MRYKPAKSDSKTEYIKALDSLTRYLALRDHSRLELRQKLSRRFSSEMVNKVLAEAEQNGWLLDEAKVAERSVAALRRRQKSQRYIEGKLRQRGLPVPAREVDSELESIRELLVRKFGEEKLSYEDKAKAFRFLKYRGFQDRAIRQVLNEKS
jgi:regulatory protein